VGVDDSVGEGVDDGVGVDAPDDSVDGPDGDASCRAYIMFPPPTVIGNILLTSRLLLPLANDDVEASEVAEEVDAIEVGEELAEAPDEGGISAGHRLHSARLASQ
jgi:hypothetical protein